MPFILGKTVSEIFVNRVKTTPNATGFSFKNPKDQWQEVRFAEFFDECRTVSFGLMGLGVQPKDRVVILSQTRYDWVLSDLAILGAGAITVPIYASSTSEDVAYILNHCEAKIAFAENQVQVDKILSQIEKIPNLQKIIVFDSNIKTGKNEIQTLSTLKTIGRREEAKSPNLFEKNLRDAKPSDLITICYTSGTTGIPKGAMISHENMVSVIGDCCKTFDGFLRPEKETVIFFLPMSHIIGKVESMATYTFGWKGCFAENLDRLMINMSEVKPTLMFSVPRIFEKAYSAIQAKLDQAPLHRRKLFSWAINSARKYHLALGKKHRPSLLDSSQYSLAKHLVFTKILARFGGRMKFAVCGGAPLPAEIATFFKMIGLPLLEGYGLTETCGPVTLGAPAHFKVGSVGRPLGEVAIQLAQDGEILIKSKKIFQGYFRMPDETAQALDTSGFHTGDIGHLDEEGFLYITDRKKDLIVTSAGKNVAPQKIENLMKSRKYINQFVVHGDRRNYLTALVTLDREQVIQYAHEHKILFSDFSGLIKHAKIQSLIQKQVDEVNTQLASFERIKKFILLSEDFTIESGDLTPSLKIRRKMITQKYKSELDMMYSP